MNEFSITTQLTKEEYSEFFINTLYKKPVTIIFGLIGVFLIVTSIADLTVYHEEEFYMNCFTLILGIFVNLMPVMSWQLAIKNFSSNKVISQLLTYTFTNEKILVKGDTLDMAFAYLYIVKFKQTSKYLLLYQTNKAAIFIKKECLTDEQINFILSKISHIKVN